MKIAYLDCFAGISGDMCLGALVDCGLSLTALKKELAKLKLKGFELKARKVQKGHLSATKVDVLIKKNIRFSHLEKIINIVDKSALDAPIKEAIKSAFLNLAKAESKVHKLPLNSLHFHQLGDLDTIVDISGFVIGCKLLGIDRVYASDLKLGRGQVICGNDVFPLPAPATLELLKNVKLKIVPDIDFENVTPTGAAIIRTFTRRLPEGVNLDISRIGYGAGTFESPGLPNALRVLICDIDPEFVEDQIGVVEANIDDMPGLNFELLYERLFAAGALDVYTQAIMMKKMRPGILITVQAEEEKLERIFEILFAETTTLGVRVNRVQRRKLERKILNMKSDYGIIVRVKIASYRGRIMNIAPEYEDCKKIARTKNLPFKTVYDKIKAQAMDEFS